VNGPPLPHPTRLELERFATDDLSTAVQEVTGAHLAACPTCRAYVAELRVATEQQLAQLPPGAFLDRHRRRRAERRRRVVAGWAGALGLGAAAAVLLLVARPRESDHARDVRLKGAGMTVYRQRGGEVRMLAADDRIRSGDALRVVLTMPKAGPIWVAALDASGRVDPLVPGGVLTLAGGEQPLPESAVVESPCSEMWLIAWPGGLPERAALTVRQSLPSLRAGRSALPASVLVRFLRCE
jgi:hypothetical protein